MSSRSRAPRGSITRERVVEAAAEIARTESLESMTMLRLARAVGCGTMTLYGHIRNKDELFEALAEHTLRDVGPPAAPRRGEDWRPPLRAWALDLRNALVGKPGVATMLSRCELPTPLVYSHLEGALRLLGTAGLNPRASAHLLDVFLAHVLGAIAWEGERRLPQAQDRHANRLRSDVEQLPRSFEALPASAEYFLDGDLDRRFEVGLDAILNGLALEFTSSGDASNSTGSTIG